MKVLIAKVGLDGHDRGLHMLAYELRERGAEVVLLGVGTRPSHIATAAVQEDVGAVGLSILSGAHSALVPKVVAELRKSGSTVPVVCGGIIPRNHAASLLDAGVAAVAPLGTLVSEAVDLVLEAAAGEADVAPPRKGDS